MNIKTRSEDNIYINDVFICPKGDMDIIPLGIEDVKEEEIKRSLKLFIKEYEDCEQLVPRVYLAQKYLRWLDIKESKFISDMQSH